jgi:hypothetical protein
MVAIVLEVVGNVSDLNFETAGLAALLHVSYPMRSLCFGITNVLHPPRSTVAWIRIINNIDGGHSVAPRSSSRTTKLRFHPQSSVDGLPMWNGSNFLPYSMSNSNNDPPPPLSERSRSSSIHMDTDQLDAVSALTSLQGAFAPPPYFASMDPMVAAAAGFYAPPAAMYAPSSSGTATLYRQPPLNTPPRSILEMNQIYSSRPPPVASHPTEEEDP